MKHFVKPSLEKGSEFKLHGHVWVVDEIFQEFDEYNESFQAVRFHLRDIDPVSAPRFAIALDDLYEDFWEDSDDYQASQLVEQLKHIEYKVSTFTDISEEDKCEIRELISKIKNKLK